MPGHRDQTQIPSLPRFNVENVSNIEEARAQMCRISTVHSPGPGMENTNIYTARRLPHSLAKVLIWMQFCIGHVWNIAALKFSLPHSAPTLRAVHNTTCHIEFLRNFKRIGMWTLNIIKENIHINVSVRRHESVCWLGHSPSTLHRVDYRVPLSLSITSSRGHKRNKTASFV